LRACCCWVSLALFVLTVAGLHATAGVPYVVGLPDVAFDPPNAGVPVAGVPAIADDLAVVSVPANPGVPILAVFLHSIPYSETETY
jgi:hypothetical protein